MDMSAQILSEVHLSICTAQHVLTAEFNINCSSRDHFSSKP